MRNLQHKHKYVLFLPALAAGCSAPLTHTPLDLTPFGAVLSAIGWLYWLIAVIALALAFKRPATVKGKATALAIVLALFGYLPAKEAWQANQIRQAKAYFEEKCRTVAGEKIYRKVENVEGVLLMKVRPNASEWEWADRNWPGAAFAREATGNGYIDTFLAYEYATVVGDKPLPITPSSRGYINTQRRPGGLPGYRWVEVIDDKDGQRYRYIGRYDEPWKSDPSYSTTYVRFNLDKTPAPGPTTRYAVTFEDHVIPEERYLGIASSTVKVLDLQTNEVLGEMTRYAWSPGAPSRVNPSPWLTAYRCPSRMWTGADTRQFVDQVLIPAKEK